MYRIILLLFAWALTAQANDEREAMKQVGRALARTDLARQAKDKVMSLDYAETAAYIAPLFLSRIRFTNSIGDVKIRTEINRGKGFSAKLLYEY
jgi:hypothetical protein